MYKKILWGVLVWGALASFGVQAGNFMGRPYRERSLEKVPIDDETGAVTKKKWSRRPQPTGRLVDFALQIIVDAVENNNRWLENVQGRLFTRQYAYDVLVDELAQRPEAQEEPLASTLPFLHDICYWGPGDFLLLHGFRVVSNRADCLTNLAKQLTPPTTPHRFFSPESTAFQSPEESDIESFSDGEEDSASQISLDYAESKDNEDDQDGVSTVLLLQEEAALNTEPEGIITSVPRQKSKEINSKKLYKPWNLLRPGIPLFIRLDRAPHGIMMTSMVPPRSLGRTREKRHASLHHSIDSTTLLPCTPAIAIVDAPEDDGHGVWPAPLLTTPLAIESPLSESELSLPDESSDRELASPFVSTKEDEDGRSRQRPAFSLPAVRSRMSQSAPVLSRVRSRRAVTLPDALPAPVGVPAPRSVVAPVVMPETKPAIAAVDDIRVVSTDVVSVGHNATDVVLVVEDAAKPGVHEVVVVQQKQDITLLQAAAITGTVAVAGLAIDYMKRGERSLVGRLLARLR
ncbi:MAG: hypothetical protein QG632_707 [Candidatus Dependentiae bacterium]|nr:hypothetical protein [Candidatus Dependentiae bacterium]